MDKIDTYRSMDFFLNLRSWILALFLGLYPLKVVL